MAGFVIIGLCLVMIGAGILLSPDKRRSRPTSVTWSEEKDRNCFNCEHISRDFIERCDCRQRFDVLTGWSIDRCRDMRSMCGPCGPSGKLFQKREKPLFTGTTDA